MWILRPQTKRDGSLFIKSVVYRVSSLAVLTLSTIVYTIGFSTPEWYRDNTDHEGLWSAGRSIHGPGVWFEAVKALATLSLIFMYISFLMGVVNVRILSRAHSKAWVIAYILLLFFSGGWSLVAIVVYGTQMKDAGGIEPSSFGYSYIMCVSATVGVFAAFGIATSQLVDRWEDEDEAAMRASMDAVDKNVHHEAAYTNPTFTNPPGHVPYL